MKEGMIFFYQPINEVKTLLPFDKAPVRSPFASRGHCALCRAAAAPAAACYREIKTTSTSPSLTAVLINEHGHVQHEMLR